jgi:hypothetical protein
MQVLARNDHDDPGGLLARCRLLWTCSAFWVELR